MISEGEPRNPSPGVGPSTVQRGRGVVKSLMRLGIWLAYGLKKRQNIFMLVYVEDQDDF